MTTQRNNATQSESEGSCEVMNDLIWQEDVRRSARDVHDGGEEVDCLPCQPER
jgi:hypothetical protein